MNSEEIKIAIVDDNQKDIDNLVKLLEGIKGSYPNAFKINSFTNGINFLESLKNGFDLIFLDIDMPTINGLELAKKIREFDEKVTLVFVTNLASCAIQGYEVSALAFLVKPITEFSLKNCFDKFIVKWKENKDDKKITIKVAHGYRALSINEIRYVEVRSHDLFFHIGNDEVLSTKGILKDVEAKINSPKFQKCNSCYLINLDYVDSVVGNDVLIGKDKLPISRNKKQNFLDAFLAYIG